MDDFKLKVGTNSEESADVTVGAVKMRISESIELYLNYLLTRNLDELHEAVRCARAILGLVLPHNFTIIHLGRSLLRRFQHNRQVEDLTEALERFQYALQLFTNDDNFVYQMCFDYLSIAYLERDGNLDGLLELNVPHVYIQSRPSLDTLTQNLSEDEEMIIYFENKTSALMSGYASHGKMEDLDTAIQFCQKSLEFFSSNPHETGNILTTMGAFLSNRFAVGRELEDINQAVECFDLGLKLQSPKSAVFWWWQSTASKAWCERFLTLRTQEDLDTAVRLAKEAVEAIEMQHSDFMQDARFGVCLDALSLALGHQYNITRDVNDLDVAIDASSRAVDITGDYDESELARVLWNLGSRLGFRYVRNGRAEDLIELITTAQRALDCLPPNHPERLSTLMSLFCNEALLSSILQDPNYLDRAEEHIRQACHLQENNPRLREGVQLNILNGMVEVLYNSSRFSDYVSVDLEKFGSTEKRAIDAAIEIARIGTSVTHHPKMIDSLFLLCICLFRKWESTHNIKDLEETISTARRVIELAEVIADKSDYSIFIRMKLGESLYNRFKCTGDKENREEALSLLLEGFRVSGVQGSTQMGAGQLAVDILIDMADWDSACKLCREIIDLFVILNDRSQAWSHKEFLLRDFSSRVATYASIALKAGSNVVDVIDMLEICRGSILGHLIDKRADLHKLTEAAPEKAKLFRTLQDEINTMMGPATNTNTRLKQVHRRIEAEGEIRACLEDIRSLEGFHQFLLGPTETELKAAAARGPILIVNVSKLRSDAIIITKHALDCLPLPEVKWEVVQGYIDKGLTDFSFEKIGQNNKEYRLLQMWLWDNCVKLIFEKLKDFGYGPAKFHVWWMGVGVANFLPFHAAGKYIGKAGETALSQAISSYTPTLRVLIHSQRKLKDALPELALQRLAIKQQIAKVKPRLTLITMPSTPGRSNLDGVRQEAEEVQKVAGETFRTQIFVQPSAKEIMSCMGECEIVHFACHGESDVRDPSCSHLLLQATAPNSTTPAVDKLKLRDVVDTDLGHGKLAFLSACSTAQSKDKQLQDEVLHLVSGFQVAGYLHAIGNLWLSDDKKSVELVKGFYKHLVAAGDFGNGDNVAEALNEAVLRLAKKYPKQPLAWAQFVHFGV